MWNTKLQKQYKSLLRDGNVIKRGHFKLTSGRHASLYINKDAIFCNPLLFRLSVTYLIEVIAMKHSLTPVITGPAIAGAVLAAPVAQGLNRTFVYPEKVDGEMVFRRGYDKVIDGKPVLVVEDIVTTGLSVRKTFDAIERSGGLIDGVVAIWNRSGEGFGNIPCDFLIDHKISSWDPKDCPECNVTNTKPLPLTDPKTGKVIE